MSYHILQYHRLLRVSWVASEEKIVEVPQAEVIENPVADLSICLRMLYVCEKIYVYVYIYIYIHIRV